MLKQSGGAPRQLTVGLTLVWGLSLLGGISAATSPDVPAPSAPRIFPKTPLWFEANVGQAEAPVQFLSRGSGYEVFLMPTETVLVLQRPTAFTQTDPLAVPPVPVLSNLQKTILRLRFVGSESHSSLPIGRRQLPGKSHYFLGNDPSEWHTQVPQYARVVYENLYPGIDLIYYGRGGQLEYDLVVAPGANPDAIAFTLEGADTLRLTPEGVLEIQTALGTVRQHPPIIYQEHEGGKTFIPGAYQLTKENRVSFTIAAYDSTRPLYIDPVLTYATYFESDGVSSLARDAAGNLYLTGAALPSTPTTVNAENNAKPSSHKGFRDAFVTKLDPTGTTVLYSTYLGGSLDDFGRDIAVDTAGHATVVGISSSDDFPTANPLQAENAGSYDVVLAKLSPNGDALEYATYLGGSGEDGLLRGLAVALDAQGNAVISGTTNSSDFKTQEALQSSFGGVQDAFVAKVQSDGSVLQFSTYLGGAKSDFGGDVAVDGVGQAYVVGTTFSEDFQTVKSLQDNLKGVGDIFITNLNSDGSEIRYSTYLGGSALDEGQGVAINAAGELFLTGHSQSTDYPGANALQDNLAGSSDAVISHLETDGKSLIYSTFVGGQGFDQGVGIAIDASGRAYVTGSTTSEDFPVTDEAFQSDPGLGRRDAFVLILNTEGTDLLYSTYLGGNGNDVGQAITVDDTQTAFIAGTTASSDLPRTAPFQAFPSRGFVAILSETESTPTDLTLTMTGSPEPVERGKPLTYTLTITNHGPNAATGVVVTDTVPARLRVESVSSSQGTGCDGEGDTLVCQLGTLENESKATIEIKGIPLAAPFILTNRASVLSDLPDPKVSNNSMQIRTDVITPEGGPMADLTLVKTDSTKEVTIGAPFAYTLTVINGGPDTAENVILTETIPPEASVGTATPSQGTCTGTRELFCRLGSLSSGLNATVSIEVIPTTTNTPVSRALATSSATDPNPVADLSVTIVGPPSPVTEGQEITFTITAANNGPDLAENVVLAVDLPTNPVENFIGAQITKGECSFPGDLEADDPLVLRCEIGVLEVKNQEGTTSNDNEGEVVLTLKVKLSAEPMIQSNVAGVGSSTFDPNQQNNVFGLALVVEESNPQSADSGDGGCFIATAAFGSPLAKEVALLRHFRDEYLLPNLAGQLLVRGYYYSSPPVATFISQHPRLKAVVRITLWPVVWWADLTLSNPFLGFLVFLGAPSFILILVFLAVWALQRPKIDT